MPAPRASFTVYQSPLTPVSEAESDTTETASTSNTTPSSSTSAGLANVTDYTPPTHKKRPLNFSRPRPVDFSPAHRVHHDRSDSFGEAYNGSTASAAPSSIQLLNNQDLNGRGRASSLPSELDFSTDHDGRTSDDAIAGAQSMISAVGLNDSFWDTQLTNMRPLRRFDYDEAQRSSYQPRLLGRTASLAAKPKAKTKSIDIPTPTIAELPGTIPPRSFFQQPLAIRRAASIASSDPSRTRRPRTAPVSVGAKIPPQIIEHEAGEDEWDGEDARSHHTVSENDELESLQQTDSSGSLSWMSSTHDASSLSSAQIKKLQKRGINPALYVEMKAARRGKGKWINPLVGNTYLS